jgi:hypothetical protein
MQEEWIGISEFPGYSVSDLGHVRNDKYDRELSLYVNQRGIVYTGLYKGHEQYKRSVSVLVANAFVTTARRLSFDTPINLDGDRENNRAENLLWRPRWYATEYFHQFQDRGDGIDEEVQEVKTGEIFKSSWQAALSFGLLEREIVRSIMYLTYALPTFQRFQMFRIHG